MANFHHRKLPDYNGDPNAVTSPIVLLGHVQPTDFGFKSGALQIIYSFKNHNWVGDGKWLHYHTKSDKCFIVLQGSMLVDVEG